MSTKRWIALAKVAGFVALVVGAIVAVRTSSFGEHFRSPVKARELVESMRPYDKPGFVLVYAVGALFLPGTLTVPAL